MNAVLRVIRLLLLPLTRAVTSASAGERPAPRPHRRTWSRRGARSALAWFPAVVLVAHGAVLLALEDPRVRDPEYGLRTARLRERMAENPNRPLVLIVGSSRTAMGVCPAEWEAIRPRDTAHPDPLLFNMAILGSGPMMELMVLRRVYADGFRPAVVLIEYWPPFLASEETWAETNRISVDRLMDCDRQFVRDYFPDPGRLEREMDHRRMSPIFANRARLVNNIAPTWLPPAWRASTGWDGLDPWGWLPGFDLKPEDTEFRKNAIAKCAEIYGPLLAKYRIAKDVERALRESVAVAREHGAAVGFIYLPEASEFRKLYPPKIEQAVWEHLTGLSRELNVPVIDCRAWMEDGAIVDGFHLSRTGAPAFTRKLGPAVAEMFGGHAK